MATKEQQQNELRRLVERLHAYSIAHLKRLHARRSLIGSIERSTTNILFAFEHVCARDRPVENVSRIQRHLRNCRTGFKALWIEGHVSIRVYEGVGMQRTITYRSLIF